MPEDAVVIYQGEEGVVYQSKSLDNYFENMSPIERNAMQSNSVTLTKGLAMGTMAVQNPHRFIKRTYGSIELKSTSNFARTSLVISGNTGQLAGNTDFYANKENFYFDFRTSAKYIYVRYFYTCRDSSAKSTLTCWLW